MGTMRAGMSIQTRLELWEVSDDGTRSLVDVREQEVKFKKDACLDRASSDMVGDILFRNKDNHGGVKNQMFIVIKEV